MRPTTRLSALLCIAALCMASLPSAAATLVPPGNRNATQPQVPAGSSIRTSALKSTYEAKYRKVLALLRNDGELRAQITAGSAKYGIDPLHMVGAIVGEHTDNVDAYDRLQTYYIKAVSYLQTSVSFGHDGETVGAFIARPQFSACE